MKVRLLVLSLLFPCLSALAQEPHLDFGATAGVPITLGVVPASTQPGFPGTTTTTTPFGPRMLFGPTATLSVDRLAVDVDVIFRPVRFESRSEETCCTLIDTVRGTSLEVPIFVRYRFGNSSLRPYAGVGLIPFETQWGRIDTHNSFHDRGDLQTHVVFSYPENGQYTISSRIRGRRRRCLSNGQAALQAGATLHALERSALAAESVGCFVVDRPSGFSIRPQGIIAAKSDFD